MRILKVLLSLALLALVACGMGKTTVGKPVPDADLMQIAEAILIKRYNLSAPPDGDNRPDYFVAVNGKAPSSDFLGRLSKGRVRFRPGSEYKPGLGTSLIISNFVWTDATHAKGDIGEVCGPLCGQGHHVVMVRKGGAWAVESMTPSWIS